VIKEGDNFLITGPDSKKAQMGKQLPSEKLWVVIKSIRGSCYKLSEGDLIRFGRVVYGIRKIGGD
jgi:hypothetical protein